MSGWDGNGNFVRVHNFSADASAGIQAQAARFDAEFDNYDTGLENCLTKTGETSPTANQPMGGYRHTGVGNAASADNYASMSDVINQTGIFVKGEGSTESGGVTKLSVSAPIYSVSAVPTDGAHIICKTDVGANGDAEPQISINRGDTKSFRAADGRPLSRDYFGTATVFNAVFDGSADFFRMLSPPTGYDTVQTVANGISSAAGVVGTGDTVSIYMARHSLHTFGKMNTTASVSVSVSADHLRFFVASTVYSSAPQHMGTGFVDDNGTMKHVQIWSYDSDIRLVPIDGAQFSGPAVKVLPFTFSYLDIPS